MPEKKVSRWDWPHGVVLKAPKWEGGYYRIAYRDPSGQRHQPSGGKDFDAAFAKGALIEAQLASQVGDADDRTVTQMATAWLAELKPEWSPRYAADQTKYVKKWVTPTIGGLHASTLTRADIKTLLAVPAAKSGRRHLRATVGGLIGWGYQENWLLLSRDALLPKKPRTAKRDADRQHGESRLFIPEGLRPDATACKSLADAMRAQGGTKHGDQYWLMTALAAATGVRQGELFALRPADVNLAAGTVDVRRQVVRVDKIGAVETRPKWGRTRVTVLPTSTLWGEPLRAPLAAYMAGMAPHGLLFPSARGGWLHASNFNKRVLKPARAAASAWAPDHSWHALRHAFCSHCVASWPEERDADGNLTRAGKVAVQDVDLAALAGHRDSGVSRAMYIGTTVGTVGRVLAILG